MPNFVSGVNIRFVFGCTASCNVYYNFQDIIYSFIPYIIRHRIFFHLKTDCAC